MILSTQTSKIGARISDAKTIELIAKSGFDAIDYSMFKMKKEDCILNTNEYEKYALGLKRLAGECGIFFNQAHAPFPSYKSDDSKYNKATFEKIIRAMEIASILGAKHIVVHPIQAAKEQKNLILTFTIAFCLIASSTI